MFIDDAREQVARLRSAAASNDMLVLGKVAHSFKGSSAGFGALHLADLCDQLATQVHAGMQDGVARLTGAIAVECERAFKALALQFPAAFTAASASPAPEVDHRVERPPLQRKG